MIRSAPALVPLALLLGACGSVETMAPVGQADASLLREGLSATSPDIWIDLVEDPAEVLGDALDCPLYEAVGPHTIDAQLGDSPLRERWSGPCTQPDGTQVSGSLERFDDGELTWLAGQGFEIRRDGELLFALDGAIELGGQGDLLLVDTTVTACGGPGADCADGLRTVDLAWTIFPSHGYPDAYDATLSGVVGYGASPVAIEGTWSIDTAACGAEPASGTIAVDQGWRQYIELDGAEDCDACATWVVKGVEVPEVCGLQL